MKTTTPARWILRLAGIWRYDKTDAIGQAQNAHLISNSVVSCGSQFDFAVVWSNVRKGLFAALIGEDESREVDNYERFPTQ